MNTSGEPTLEVDGVSLTHRDVEALRAIAETGSMSKAADSLGRSYSRIQQRITDLESSVGPLVSRTRGGSGGGGSSLTTNAKELLTKYDRLQAELSGLARAEESVFPGTVVDRDGMLATIETASGRLRGIAPPDATDVQVSIRSDAVALTTPDAAPEPTGTSVRNQFHGTVTGIESGDGLATVTIDVGADAPLRTLLTETSLDTMALAVGDEVVASFKATATRAVPTPDIE